jgi:hypothetical protein
MNTTTFTIESVHGVKQTFVLGVFDRPGSNPVAKEKPTSLTSKPVENPSQNPASTHR